MTPRTSSRLMTPPKSALQLANTMDGLQAQEAGHQVMYFAPFVYLNTTKTVLITLLMTLHHFGHAQHAGLLLLKSKVFM